MFSAKKSLYIPAPCFFDTKLLSTMTRQQLIDHAIAMTEYAQKLEGGK